MPLQASRVHVDCKDRGDIQIVEAFGALSLSNLLRPRKAVACTDINQLGIRIVGHTVPHRTAPAVFPPFARPGLGSDFHGFALEWLRWIARHCIKTPKFLSVINIECGQVSAIWCELRACIADDHLALYYSWRHREAVVLRVLFRYRDNRPKNFSCSGVESNKTAVNDRDNDFTLIQCDAAAYYAAAQTNAPRDDLRVIAPDFFSGSGVNSKRDAPVRDPVKNTVCKQRRRFLRSTTWTDFVRPCRTQAADICRIDLFQRAVALLGVGVAVAQPFCAFVCVLQSTVVHPASLPRRNYSGYKNDCRKRHQQPLQSRYLHVRPLLSVDHIQTTIFQPVMFKMRPPKWGSHSDVQYDPQVLSINGRVPTFSASTD